MIGSRGVPVAAWERFQQLEREEKFLRDTMDGQVGTSVPRVFYATDNFIINPSNVGTATLARMVETDPTVLAAIQFRVLMILAKIGEYHHDNPEIKEFVNGYLKQMRGPTWRRSIEAILSSAAFGFSASEIVFGLDEEYRKVPTRLATYHPSTMAFEVDSCGQITENGVLQYVLQYSQISNPNSFWTRVGYGTHAANPFTTPTDRLLPSRIPFVYNYGLVRIPRKKIVHSVNFEGLSFGSPYGKTAVRTAHLAWQLKVFFMKQMGVAGKRNATPTLWAAAPHGTNNVKLKKPNGEEVLVSPAEAVRMMLSERETDDAVITGPQSLGYHIEAIQDQANLDQFLAVINALDVYIFRGFLMPSLIMTDGSAGSRSLGDKHFEIVDRISESDADHTGQLLINDMIERTVYENYGKQKDYGHFTQRPQSIEERARLHTMFAEALTVGTLKAYSPNDMSFIRSSVHFPQDSDPTSEIIPEKKDEDRDPLDAIKDDGAEK